MNNITRKTKMPSTKFAALSVLAAGSIAMGAFFSSPGLQANFTGNNGSVNTAETGTVNLAFGDTSGPYSVTINNLLPGQSQSAYFNVKNVGSLKFGKLDAVMKSDGPLVDKPAPSRVYQTVGSNGTIETKTGNGGSPALVKIESCSVAWVNGVCSTGAVRNYGEVSGTNNSPVFNIIHGNDLKPGELAYLKATYTLPSTSGPEYEGKSASFSYTMTATQRDEVTSDGRRAF